ncbi:AMP-binding protein [Desulfospira joergensenii]|uniref:AMP-binding protein n=1 Tax=Desulfospira joergensenii TaxID=53329 RepID=UPI0003B31A10|nr:AMP-binding protein [Desulfospira joergensenii]
MPESKPWLKFYSAVPTSLDYPDATMYEAVMKTVNRVPDRVAWDFMGTLSTYAEFGRAISRCADALSGLGLKKGDVITISMPTSPQGIICFYAANKIGAIASMIHPLSTQSEIEFYLDLSGSTLALTLDAFYDKFSRAMEKTSCKKLILTRIGDYLSPVKRMGFWLTKGRKIPRVPEDPKISWWQEIMNQTFPAQPAAEASSEDTAVILYSGGTTGRPKGIMLSNKNFISEGMMVAAWGNLDENDTILAILPIFHGFGLGVCVNAAFMAGGRSILVPQFSPEITAGLIKAKKPNFIIGVPTLYAALNKNKIFSGADLSCLKAAFSGADTLPQKVKTEFEALVRRRGGKVKLLEGYGLTEAVTAIMAMPMGHYREGSVGIPFPDMDAKIVSPGTTKEVPPGEDGEICLSGPAVMKGYLNQEEESRTVLKIHEDEKTWLHTGDIASRDEDGFFYFKLRLKRMIKSSGMNVYPAQVEEIIYEHGAVSQVCVIGVPDRDLVERVKAFVVLKPGFSPGPDMEEEIITLCREKLIKWSCPRSVEFRDTLPFTRVGKVAFKTLEDQEIQRLRREGKYAGENKS